MSLQVSGLPAVAPLLPAVVLLMLGMTLGDPGPGGKLLWSPWWTLLGGFLAWGIWGFLELGPPRRLGLVFLMLALVAAGMGYQQLVSGRRGRCTRWLPPDQWVLLEAQVEITECSHFISNGRWRARAKWLAFQEGGQWQRASGPMEPLEVDLIETPPDAQPGACYELQGWACRLWQAGDMPLTHIRTNRPEQCRLLRTSSNWRWAWQQAWIARLRGLLESCSPLAGQLSTALLLGYRDPLMGALTRDFARAGIAHLLAISGQHVLLLVACWSRPLSLLVAAPRWRMAALMVLVSGYYLITPGEAPVARATGCFLLAVLGRLAGLNISWINTLALMAGLLILENPSLRLAAGFQLSFLCAAALVAFAQPCFEWFWGPHLERVETLARIRNTPWAFRRWKLWRGFLSVLTLNLVGSFFAAPLVAYHFHQWNLWAWLTGLLALPLVLLVMLSSQGLLLLGAALAPTVAWLDMHLAWTVHAMAGFPGSCLTTRSPPLSWVIAFYLAALVAYWYPIARPVKCLALVAGWVLLAMIWPRPAASLVWLDAPRGLLLESDSGRRIFIDAGESLALRRRRLAAQLADEGIDRLDLVVLAGPARGGEIAGLLQSGLGRRLLWPPEMASLRDFARLQRWTGAVYQAGDRINLGKDSLRFLDVVARDETAHRPSGLVMELALSGQRLRVGTSQALLGFPGVADAMVVLGTLTPREQLRLSARTRWGVYFEAPSGPDPRRRWVMFPGAAARPVGLQEEIRLSFRR